MRTWLGTWRGLSVALVATACLGMATSARDSMPLPPRAAALVHRAQQREARGRYVGAARLYGRAAKRAEESAAIAGLLLRRADNLFAAEKYFPAWETYKGAAENYMPHLPFEHVTRRMRELAELFATGEASRFGFRSSALALEVYELILKKAPAGEKAPADKLRLAQLQSANDAEDEAIVTLRELRRRYPGSPEAAEAELELGRLLYKMGEEGDGDGRMMRQARRELDSFLQGAESHPRREQAQILLSMVEHQQADALYRRGEFYTRVAHRRLPAARRYLHDVLREYRSTTVADRARHLLARIEAGEFGDVREPTALVAGTSAVAATSAVEVGAKPDDTVRRPAPPPVEAMTPDKLATPRAFKPLEQGDDPQKWLLPLGDLNVPAEGKVDE